MLSLYVTGFVKIDPNHARTEIHFIAEHYSFTITLTRNAKHMAKDGQVCFHRRPFATLSDCQSALQGLGGQWMASIRMGVVPHCCQRLSWLILWIKFVFCHLLKIQHSSVCSNRRYNRLWLPTCIHHPPHPPTSFNVPSVILQSLWKNCSKPSSVS